MSATNLQLANLALGPQFQGAVRASIMKKAVAIVDDVRANGNLNYTPAQRDLARSLAVGGNLAPYYLPLACSTNVMASNITINGAETLSDISDAALDSQVFTTVFLDLI